MLNTVRLIADSEVTATPVPGVGAQVASDLKDVVSSAAESAGNMLDHVPQTVSHLLMAGGVLVIGLLLLKLGRLIIARIAANRVKKNPGAAQRSETFKSIVSSVFNAFGLLFGKGVFARYLEKGPAFAEDYCRLLRSCGSASVADVAASVGIDVRDPAFWRSSLEVIRKDIDEFCELAENN